MTDIPGAVPPILAVDGELPTGAWAYEYKWDGYRCCLRAAPDGTTRLTSRNGNDLTATYPELAGVPPAAFGGLATVLDGEIVALDAAGRPDFGLLQRRHQRRPGTGRPAAPAVTYFAFDLLLRGQDTHLRAPYAERRAALSRFAAAAEPAAGGRLAVPPHYTGPGIGPQDLLGIAEQHGLEGLLAKRLDSPYQPGRRSRLWIKRPLVSTQEAVIGGWQPGDGRRSGTVGSLLLGAHDAEGHLRYIGHVGSGFTAATLADLLRRLTPLARATSPFDGPVPREHARTARWTEPRLVGEVAFRAWTRDLRLRQPSWRGLRPDRSPEGITLPGPPPGNDR
ncbi:non-homologous end-joining DNA ligase [Streptomyces sp. MP131-18]|uniref:non-homologous end-joining DNA ligase n=1 Tax=Streptomyces sp. MP131-18 TaxID=1857892 RepID=UPI00097BFEFB|nr:non-homologous end-joining DNA ligase [Streptomyces sp. MP131-18]ONK10148.1 putative DNA ligase-like protein [Streptomyces sp. MP131-18]